TDGAWVGWPVPGAAPLGVPAPDVVYPEGQRALAAGEYLLAFTDGVTETGARQGSQFQHGQLDVWLASLPARPSPAAVGNRLLIAFQSYGPGAWPEDDTTVFCLLRR